MPKDDIEGGSKRVTVLFNAKDMRAINREVTRRQKEAGYPISVSDVLRDLVREHWMPAR